MTITIAIEFFLTYCVKQRHHEQTILKIIDWGRLGLYVWSVVVTHYHDLNVWGTWVALPIKLVELVYHG